MTVELVWDPALARYRFPRAHPMRPERFTLTVELARLWGLLDAVNIMKPTPATDSELELIHSTGYVHHVKAASRDPHLADPAYGLGDGDTPAFRGVHEAAALATGASIEALEAVVSGRVLRAFNPAGGMHHAQRDRASGFCVYNDCAIAIEKAVRSHDGLRVAYIDIDAHHGDGVERAFFDRADVLTASVHESGAFLFPGTGREARTGEGAGRGFAINAPLLPDAGDAEYLDAVDGVIAPAVREFAPDVIFAQLGADAHEGDPLTHLRVTTPGFIEAVRHLVALADEVCGGRIAATGGGGYQPFTAVPEMWASALAVLIGATVPQAPPPQWAEVVARTRAQAEASE